MMRHWSLLIVAAALVAVAVMPGWGADAQAAGTRTVTYTEAEINASYRVTNPVRRSISNLSVDLQPGMAVISSTHTLRVRGQDVVYACSSVWSPVIANQRLTWNLNSATCNGQPAPQQLINQVNASIGSSWRNYWRGQHGGRVQSVTITDDAIVLVTG
ncbi:MAG: hypothetical protein ACUVS2_06345 [Candidatus Flexifilum sp.]